MVPAPRRLSLLACALFLGLAEARAAEEVPEREEDGVRDLSGERADARGAPGDEEPTAAELARRVDILAAEIERIRLGEAAPVAEGSRFGLGPAASKVYRTGQGVSVGGYGEMLYRNHLDPGKDDVLDFLRAIVYVGYKFSDKWVFNSEIEIEHANEIYLEFAYVDFLWRPELAFRAGMVLSPMGLVNELHEPTTYLGATRPEVEQRILPTTWRENGAGILGDIGPLAYRAYVMNGLRASGFGPAGLRGGRQKGASALANDLAGVARVDYGGVPGLLVGGSAYYGRSGQELDAPVPTLVYEAHGDYRWRGLQVRALFAGVALEGVEELHRELGVDGGPAVGDRMRGWYLQGGFDVLSLFPGSAASVTPFVRYEDVAPQHRVPKGIVADRGQDVRLVVAGVQVQPIGQVVLEAEFQHRRPREGDASGQIHGLVGYVF